MAAPRITRARGTTGETGIKRRVIAALKPVVVPPVPASPGRAQRVGVCIGNTLREGLFGGSRSTRKPRTGAPRARIPSILPSLYLLPPPLSYSFVFLALSPHFTSLQCRPLTTVNRGVPTRSCSDPSFLSSILARILCDNFYCETNTERECPGDKYFLSRN